MSKRYLTVVLLKTGELQTTYAIDGEDEARQQMVDDKADPDVRAAALLDVQTGEFIDQI